VADEAESDAERLPVEGFWAVFPPAQWLPRYRSQWLSKDAVAGITLAAYGIPVSLAYASLAGLPPEYGIYGYLVGGLGYALFGSSRQLAIGPTSAISMLVGATVGGTPSATRPDGRTSPPSPLWFSPASASSRSCCVSAAS
jgi:MFS superfamily sulfate permease-like transporter